METNVENTLEIVFKTQVQINNEIDDYILNLITDYAETTCNRKVVVNAEKIVNAIETVEEYRWHDLRENPEDLPKNGELVVVQFAGLPVPLCGVYDSFLHAIVAYKRSLRLDECNTIGWKKMDRMD